MTCNPDKKVIGVGILRVVRSHGLDRNDTPCVVLRVLWGRGASGPSRVPLKELSAHPRDVLLRLNVKRIAFDIGRVVLGSNCRGLLSWLLYSRLGSQEPQPPTGNIF